MILSVGVPVFLYVTDRISKFGLKTGNIEAMVEIQKDVSTKAEVIEDTVERIGEISAFTLSRVGRFTSPSFFRELYEERHRLAKLLHDMNIEDNRVDDILSRVDVAIENDFAHEISKLVRVPFQGGARHNEIADEARRIVREAHGEERNKLRLYLKSLDGWSDSHWTEEMDQLLTYLERYRSDRQLPDDAFELLGR